MLYGSYDVCIFLCSYNILSEYLSASCFDYIFFKFSSVVSPPPYAPQMTDKPTPDPHSQNALLPIIPQFKY